MQTTDRILYAAMQIIADEGLKGLSASKLADASGISKSTVFHYFNKMDDIPAMILEKLYVDIINPVQEEHYKSLRAYLTALGESTFSNNQQHIMIYKAFASLFQAGMHDEQLTQIINSCSEKFRLMLSSKLQQLCSSKLSDDDLTALAALIMTSLDGIGLHYLINKNQEQAKKAWELFIDAIVTKYDLEG